VSNVLAANPAGAVASPMPQFQASYAIDGDFTTRWDSAIGVDPQWIYVDYGAPVFFSEVQILWFSACAANYDLQVSKDATSWTTMKSIIGNTVGSGAEPVDWTGAVDTKGLSGVGRYLRVYGTTRCTIYSYSIWEMRAFGDTNASCTP
jgi:hypothetical protein